MNVYRGAMLGAALLLTTTTAQAGGLEKAADSSLTLLYASTQCGRSRQAPQIRVIDSSDELKSLHSAITGPILVEGAREVPAVDFRRYRALLIEMGRKPTGGYSLSLADPVLRVADGVATLVVDWREPSADMMLTQALTSPCLLLRLSRDGYSVLEVRDDSGKLRGRETVGEMPNF